MKWIRALGLRLTNWRDRVQKRADSRFDGPSLPCEISVATMRTKAMPTNDKTPSGSHVSDISFDLYGRFLSDDMVNGRLIAAARTLLGWDQRELAHRAGIRRHTLAALEGDVRRSQARVREAVLDVLIGAGIRFVTVSERTGVIYCASDTPIGHGQ